MLKAVIAGAVGAALMAVVLLVVQGQPEMEEAAAPAPAASAPIIPGGSGTVSGLTQEMWDADPETMAWQAVAYEIAGDDPDLIFDAGIFCQPSRGVSNENRATIGTAPEYLPASLPQLEPFPMPDDGDQIVGVQRLFDNFYWIGNTGIGIWVVTSDDGYIVYDAMNRASDAPELIIPAMESIGLDPTRIKYLVFGHYHGDHVGAGTYLQEISGAQAIMGWADWELYLRRFNAPGGTGGFVRDGNPMPQDLKPMTRDIDAEDGMAITVGDVTANIYQMTGHTPGSLAMIVPVKYQGEEHPILLVTAGNHFTNINAFIGGYEHIWDIAIERGVESVMQSHPNTNMNLLARTTYEHENYPPAVNPLLYGAERTEKYLNIVRACSRAWIAAVDML